MKLLRLALLIVAGLVLVVSSAGGFLAWLLMTEAGTVWLIARIEQRIPAVIVIERIGGTIWDGLELAGVAISTETAAVEIDSAELELALDALLERRVVLERLDVGTVRYERRDSPAAGDRGPIAVPIPIDIDAGTLDALTVTLGEATQTFGPIELAGSVVGDRVVFDELAGTALGFSLRGSGAIVLADEIELDSAFEWSTVRGGTTYAGRGDAVGTWPTLRVHQEIAMPQALVADGELTFGESPTAEFELSWDDLQWPWAPNVSSDGGRMRVAGWRDGVTFEADGNVTIDGIASAITASGTATLSDVQFDRLDAVGEFGRVMSAGQLVIAPLSWRFDVRTEDLDPSVRFAEWPGALEVVGQFSGRTQPGLRLGLANATVAGVLRERPIEASGGVEYAEPGAWQFAAVTVAVASNRLRLDGAFNDALDLRVVVDAADLAELFDDAAGALTVDGMLAGSRQAPAFRGVVSGADVRYGRYSAASLTLDGEVIADAARTVELDLNASSLRVGDREIDTLVGLVRGNAADHAAELNATAEYGSASLRARGEWSADTWSGVVSSLELTEPTLGRWVLDMPTAVSATRASVELERTCVSQGTANLCVSLRAGTDADGLEVALRSFDLAVLAAVFPESTSITGIYDADLSLVGPLRQPTGRFSTQGTNSLITIREPEQPPFEMPIETLRADAELTSAGELSVNAEFDSSTGGSVNVVAIVTALWSEEPTVEGEVAGRWPDLAFLSLLSPDVGEVSGIGSVDLSFDGPLRDPQVRGSAAWLEGRLAVPRFGLVIEDIDASIASADGRELSIDASGFVGSGELSVTGTTQIDADAGWPTRLQIFGERLEAVRLPEAQILLTPALAVDAALPDINVTGAFLVPRARLTLDELPPQAATPSPDTVIHGVARETGPRPLNMHADIRVGLGEDVRYSGAGLDVALAGSMGLTYQSGESAVASGAVTLSGQYQAYGQTLEIDEGRLLFTGPLANPNLDVRAVRRIDETTVGIQLSGTVDAPVSRVFSEPAMNEADALAYLLLGRPLSTSGDQEAASLEAAAFAMGLQQALPVIQRVGESLGLDEFSVQTTTADTGELMAGKRLSPRVYIRYSYGLFNRIGGLLMRFSLNNRLSLETRSGDYSSMDLIYTVERD